MLVDRCDHCGRPVRLQLAKAEHACAGCGKTVNLDPNVAERLSRARDALLRMDVRKRQLTSRQRSNVEGSSGWFILLLVMIAFVTLPFAGCAGLATFGMDAHPSDRPYMAIFFSLPLLVMLGVDALVIRAFRRARRRLLDACAAIPPAAPGESASCHVCGGPLTSTGAIARCSFCSADNAVSPEVMARKQQREGTAAGDIETRVLTEATIIGKTTGALLLATFGALVAVPIFLFLLSTLLFFACRSWERPADASIEYAVVATSKGNCIGRIDGSTVYMSSRFSQDEKTFPLGTNARFRAASIEGKQARPTNAKTYAKVERVTSSPFYGNLATMHHPEAVNERTELVDLCLEP